MLGHPRLRLLRAHLLLRPSLLGVHLPMSLRLLRMHLPLRLSLLDSHVALSLRLLHSLRTHLLAFVHLRLSVHCRAMLRVCTTAAARREHSRLGRVEVGARAAAAGSEPWPWRPWSECSMAAASPAAALLGRASSKVRVTPTAATSVRTAAVTATRACVGSRGNCQSRSACEKNEPFHGETPFRSPAKRFANRPVPPFMCMKGEYSLLRLA
jgi:hypothetical protein